MKWENIQRELKEEMMNIFTDEGGHSFFEAILKKKSTFIILLRALLHLHHLQKSRKIMELFWAQLIILDALRLHPKKFSLHLNMNILEERVLVNCSSI